MSPSMTKDEVCNDYTIVPLWKVIISHHVITSYDENKNVPLDAKNVREDARTRPRHGLQLFDGEQLLTLVDAAKHS